MDRFPLRDESCLNMATAAGHRVSGSPAHAPSRDELLPGERRPGHARVQFYVGHRNIHHTVRYAELAAGTFKDIGGISPSQSGRRRRPESRRGVREKEAPFVMGDSQALAVGKWPGIQALAPNGLAIRPVDQLCWSTSLGGELKWQHYRTVDTSSIEAI